VIHIFRFPQHVAQNADRYTDTVSRCPSPQGVGRALIHSLPAFPIKHPHGFNVSSARSICPQRLHFIGCLQDATTEMLSFFIAFRDPKGHDSTLENTVSSVPQLGAQPQRPIANRPQVDNLPHVDLTILIPVRGPEAHQDRSEICPTRAATSS